MKVILIVSISIALIMASFSGVFSQTEEHKAPSPDFIASQVLVAIVFSYLTAAISSPLILMCLGQQSYYHCPTVVFLIGASIGAVGGAIIVGSSAGILGSDFWTVTGSLSGGAIAQFCVPSCSLENRSLLLPLGSAIGAAIGYNIPSLLGALSQEPSIDRAFSNWRFEFPIFKIKF
jgi:hypothetical protein